MVVYIAVHVVVYGYCRCLFPVEISGIHLGNSDPDTDSACDDSFFQELLTDTGFFVSRLFPALLDECTYAFQIVRVLIDLCERAFTDVIRLVWSALTYQLVFETLTRIYVAVISNDELAGTRLTLGTRCFSGEWDTEARFHSADFRCFLHIREEVLKLPVGGHEYISILVCTTLRHQTQETDLRDVMLFAEWNELLLVRKIRLHGHEVRFCTNACFSCVFDALDECWLILLCARDVVEDGLSDSWKREDQTQLRAGAGQLSEQRQSVSAGRDESADTTCVDRTFQSFSGNGCDHCRKIRVKKRFTAGDTDSLRSESMSFMYGVFKRTEGDLLCTVRR